jgi:hypothetical protein
MADGFTTTLADSILNNLTDNGSWSEVTAIYAELHTASPGAAGTTGVSAGSSTRLAVTYSSASGGSATITGNVGPWTNGGTSETLTDVAFWTASTSGTFLWSAAMGSSHAWASGDTFTLTAATLTVSPLAA